MRLIRFGFKPILPFVRDWSHNISKLHRTKYVQLNLYSSIVQIKASYASMESVSDAKFWNSAAFGRM